MNISRGIASLILSILFQTSLFSQYLHKDDVIQTAEFSKEIEELGAELYEKTSIALKLVMIREIPNGMDILAYEKEILASFDEPTILLVFAELNSKVDIAVNDVSLYTLFDRGQVLSPVASSAQAFAMALFFARSIDDFKELSSDSGGTILPLLGAKSKGEEITGKYAAAMFNGYLDIAEQVAISKEVELSQSTGKSSENILLGIKVIFYGILLMALVMYIRKKFFYKEEA